MALTAESLSQSEAAELLDRARAGDGDAFCRLAEQSEERLLRQALGMTGQLAAAEDLVAETMVEAWRSLGRFHGTCQFSTWLFSILLHRYQKHVRRCRCRPVSLSTFQAGEAEKQQQVQENLPGSEPSPSQALVQKETGERLRLALSCMKEEHRQVLLMRFFQDASLQEIAAALQCPVGTVKSRLHYALEELRKSGANLNAQDPGEDT